MKYLEQLTKEKALAYSAAELIKRRPDPDNKGGDGKAYQTLYWWGVVEHPTSKMGAVQVPLKEVASLPSSDQAKLKTEQQMKDDGWFPDELAGVEI